MRVKKQFLEKKIDKYRDYIKNIPLKEDNQLKIFDVTIMLNVIRYENLSIFVNYKMHFPSHYLERNYISNGETTMWLENITNGEMQITESEYILYGFEKRLAYICNYFKNLEDFEEIDLRVFNEVKKAEGVKGYRKIEERVSTVVKSHIRRYKSGLGTMKKIFFIGAIMVLIFGVCKVWYEETVIEKVYILDK